jgi:undecaprenyl diphosphate synthase
MTKRILPSHIGFLPVQSAHADFFIVDEHWPDFMPATCEAALGWFRDQGQTLGG